MSSTTFHGAKVAVVVDGKLLMHLRDNKPGLFNSNMWDFPGGGRKGEESPEECAIREIQEEFNIKLKSKDLIWKKEYPAQKDKNSTAYFLVAKISKGRTLNIELSEGQEWKFLT